MKVNEGPTDRIIRAVLGVALVLAGLLAVEGTAGIVLVVLGGIVLVTAATGFCGLYALLGISTLKK
jgi:uncharacterized membrane protein